MVGPIAAVKLASPLCEATLGFANVQEPSIEEFMWVGQPYFLNDFIIL
jgi:hypothetical protein